MIANHGFMIVAGGFMTDTRGFMITESASDAAADGFVTTANRSGAAGFRSAAPASHFMTDPSGFMTVRFRSIPTDSRFWPGGFGFNACWVQFEVRGVPFGGVAGALPQVAGLRTSPSASGGLAAIFRPRVAGSGARDTGHYFPAATPADSRAAEDDVTSIGSSGRWDVGNGTRKVPGVMGPGSAARLGARCSRSRRPSPARRGARRGYGFLRLRAGG